MVSKIAEVVPDLNQEDDRSPENLKIIADIYDNVTDLLRQSNGSSINTILPVILNYYNIILAVNS